jgi:hypothetical protein
VIECDPAASVDVINVATPPAPTAPVPIEVPPSRNVTVPVIVPAVVDVTVAVKVTVAPAAAGFGAAITLVLVAAMLGGVAPVSLSKITPPIIKSIFPS